MKPRERTVFEWESAGGNRLRVVFRGGEIDDEWLSVLQAFVDRKRVERERATMSQEEKPCA